MLYRVIHDETNHDIGDILGISYRTINKYLEDLFKKRRWKRGRPRRRSRCGGCSSLRRPVIGGRVERQLFGQSRPSCHPCLTSASWLRIQPVDATRWLNRSAGVS